MAGIVAQRQADSPTIGIGGPAVLEVMATVYPLIDRRIGRD